MMIVITLALAACASAHQLDIHASSPPAPFQQRDDSSAVLTVVRGFKNALAAGDSTQAISFLHQDLIVFESRRAENLAEYRSGHLAADIAFLKTVKQTTTRESLRISGDLAVYVSLYTSAGTSRGRAVNSNGTETMVLARTPAGCRILHIHW
jgi:ketosteroid isomerase-like protein